MPGVTLPNMGIILPTLGGDPGVWDDEVNAAFGLVDDHDHTPGKGVKIPVSGLNINADVPLGGNGLTTIGRLAFSQVAALTTGSVTLFVNTADHELYWRNNGGTNVKLTAGGSINTTLVGGIVGDYSAVGAEVAYDDANKRYTFKYNGTPKPWAKMASADLHIYPTGTGTIYNGIKASASLAASFDITLPLALPASQVLVQVDATGVMTFTNTLPANTDITLSGTGKVKHGAYTKRFPVIGSMCQAGTGAVNTTAGTMGVQLGNNTTAYIPVPAIALNERYTVVELWFLNSTDAGNCTTKLYRSSAANPETGVLTDLLTSLTPSGAVASCTIAIQPVNAETLWIKVTNSVTTPSITAVGISWDVP